jgi:demethylmenaquinone methyltransferase/2-methoxy-6-polyprenyl-1,4-benzoquinol methylase
VRFGRLGFFLDKIPAPNVGLLEGALGPTRGFVLDLGGGTGRIARQMRSTQVVVCDIERRLLVRARSHGLPTVQCDARALPFRSGALAGAFCVDAFHHFPEPEAVASEVRRTLREDARWVVEEFHPDAWATKWLRLVETVAHFGSHFEQPASLARILSVSGFVVRIERWSNRDYAAVGSVLAAKRP